ncbi:MAG: hypothetical protein HY654_03360, partial [Acidobacteria bacterium]|nr:hypothetical protein [Acidobacteriota bacterium]
IESVGARQGQNVTMAATLGIPVLSGPPPPARLETLVGRRQHRGLWLRSGFRPLGGYGARARVAVS